MKSNLKTMLSSMLVILFFVTSLPPVQIFAFEKELDVNVYSIGKAEGLLFNGMYVPSSDARYDDKDGVPQPAYCVNPNLAGVGEVGDYKINVNGAFSNPAVLGIVLNGFPYKTAAELGVNNDAEAYTVTKSAIWAYLAGSKYQGIDKWTAVAGKEYMLTAMKNIYSKGILNKEIKPSYASTKSETTKAIDDGDFLSQVRELETNYPTVDYKVEFKGHVPDGTIITDEANNPKTEFKAGEKFKIRIPKSSLAPNEEGIVETEIEANVKCEVLLYGKAYKTGVQNYAVAMPIQPVWTPAKTPYGNPETDTPTPPPIKTPKGKLKILKVAAGTQEPLAGAEFRVTKADGGVIGVFISDDKGEVIVENLEFGTYYIDELTPPTGYVLDKISHKDVVLKTEDGTIVSFSNEKRTSLEVIKVDGDTNEVLKGASIRIALDGGHESFDLITDASGRVFIEDLKSGTYTVSETVAPQGYILDTTKYPIKLVEGQDHSMTIENFKKPGILIKKYDEGTSLPLGKAEFSIAKKGENGGSITHEGMVDDDGLLLFEGLDEGWYTITEIAAPDGYLIATKSKDVYLPKGKSVEVKFDNRKRPALEIIKLDEKTKLPLAGAKFRVIQTENQTISEYVTGADGKIFIDKLDEVIYSIEEIVSPDGYILEPQHKDIKLEWGKTKTLIFTNKEKPKLEILKIDSVTKKPIPNTKFKVEKIEDKTVSEYITDNDGKILIEKLDEANYKITETIANDEYILNSTPKDISLEWGKTKQLIFENTKKPTLIITKINGLTNKPIPNTTYKIEWEAPNGGLVSLGTFRTNQNGQIIIPKVNTGWYVITETIPAQGMSKPSNPVRRVFLTAGENSYLSDNTTTGVENTESPVTTNIVVQSGTDFTKTTNASGEEIINYPLNSIVLKKAHAITGEMLAGAVFELRQVTNDISGGSGTIIGRYTTNYSGIVVITGLEAGGYIAEEVQAPENFSISENSKQQAWLRADGTSIVEITFSNYPYGHILITKVDAQTLKPLANARFRVIDGTGAVAGNTNGEYITNENGEALVSNLKPNSYVITEIEAPENYIIDTTPQTITVGSDGKTYKVNFKNQPVGKLVIKKYNSVTKEPLADAEFKLTTSKGDVVGTGNGIYKTDEKGSIEILNLPKGTYVAQEIKAPLGFILEQQTQTIDIEYGRTHVLDFYNKPKSSLQIIKIDAETKLPLKEAKFSVFKKNGELIGEYVTDGNGLIMIPDLEPNWYKITEVKAPNGYKIDETAKDVELTSNQFLKVVFENRKLTSLIIKKVDEKNGSPLIGAKFSVERQNGEHIGEYTTDSDGTINIPTLQPDWYVIREKFAPKGYYLDESPKTVEVKTDTPTIVTFTNKKLTALEIIKVDEKTNEPLNGAVFVVEKQNGERIGEFTTSDKGIISIPTLQPDFYVVKEIKAPDGYVLSSIPKVVEVKTDSPTVVTFTNKALAGLKIIKLNSVNRNPIEGAEFVISKMSGEKIENDFKGFTFKTDKTGQIFIPNLTDGYYLVTETKAAEGFILDSEPKTVLIESGKNTLLEVENTPASGLLVIKTDLNTKKPLAGVKFSIKKANGERVQSSLLDKNQPTTENNSPNKSTTPNGDISGVYTTDANGRILINYIAVGEYNVTELEPLKGYELDTDVHSVTVTAGKQAVLELTNKPLSGLKILKIDSITKEPIFNVEFMLFDQNNKVVGNFYTDDQGVIDFSSILTEGRYTIRETRPAEGYYEDTKPRTIEFISGKVTEITWENIPKAGQIQITKYSADNNEINGLEAGTELEGAIFEVFAYKSGNLVDRFITGYDGKGVSKPLPLGRYLIKEVQAPPYYKLNKKELDITIEFATQIIKLEFTNESANTGVSIDKVAPKEVMPNQIMRYDIKKVRNDSTVALSDFYWRDTLPVDAVRIDKIVTGSYNQSLKYKIMATTNKGNSMVIADNLMTTKNNVIDCSNVSLGLGNDEFVTSFTLYFGNVKAGFTSVEEPKIYAKVLNKNLPSGYRFSNKVDVGGKYQGEWVVGNSTTNTTIYTPVKAKLPKTGN